MQLIFYLSTFSTPCMGHLLYLMFRCDGKFGGVGGSEHNLRHASINSCSQPPHHSTIWNNFLKDWKWHNFLKDWKWHGTSLRQQLSKPLAMLLVLQCINYSYMLNDECIHHLSHVKTLGIYIVKKMYILAPNFLRTPWPKCFYVVHSKWFWISWNFWQYANFS